MSDSENASRKRKIDSAEETDPGGNEIGGNDGDVENAGTTEAIGNQKDDNNGEAKPEPEPEKCGYWVKRKKRFCRMLPVRGMNFCAEHRVVDHEDSVGEVRVPCPLDPSHTVYKRKLMKHVNKCNAYTAAPRGSHIEKGINVGESTEDLSDAKNIILSHLSDEEFFGTIEIVKKLHSTYIEGNIRHLFDRHYMLEDEIDNDEYGRETKKHLIQSASLLAILENEGQFKPDTTFVEFGAGKGQMSFYLAVILDDYENSRVVLIDRMSLRHKKDNKIENRNLVRRVRADIADLKLEGLGAVNKGKRCVAISKHLCGSATDLSLRCIIRMPPGSTDNNATTEFIMIALCCHHRCDWKSFVGKKFFIENKLTPRQFVIITKMASWAVCGTGFSRERRMAFREPLSFNELDNDMKTIRLTISEREEIGILCKQLIDYARCEYLKEHGYEVSLNYYVERTVTLENVCLLARKVT